MTLGEEGTSWRGGQDNKKGDGSKDGKGTSLSLTEGIF